MCLREDRPSMNPRYPFGNLGMNISDVLTSVLQHLLTQTKPLELTYDSMSQRLTIRLTSQDASSDYLTAPVLVSHDSIAMTSLECLLNGSPYTLTPLNFIRVFKELILSDKDTETLKKRSDLRIKKYNDNKARESTKKKPAIHRKYKPTKQQNIRL